MSTIRLTAAERKTRLPFGAQKEIAKTCAVSTGYVSKAVADDIRPKTKRGWKTLRRVRRVIAHRLGVPVDVAFAPDEIQSATSRPEQAVA